MVNLNISWQRAMQGKIVLTFADHHLSPVSSEIAPTTSSETSPTLPKKRFLWKHFCSLLYCMSPVINEDTDEHDDDES